MPAKHTTPSELENHLGIADKTLAEFVIDIAKASKSSKEYGAVRWRAPSRQHTTTDCRSLQSRAQSFQTASYTPSGTWCSDFRYVL